MAKDKISQYSTTNALNTDIGGIDIDENCLPSNLNNGIREVMVQLKEFQDGTSGDSLTITGTATLNGTTIPASKTLVDTDSAQTLTNKTLTSPAITTPTGIVKGDVGLGNVDNTSDATKNSATATLTNKTLTSPVVNTPNLTGGTINNATIGATTPSTVASTNLSYTGTLTGGTGVVNLGSGQVYKDASGNVGVGTSSPLGIFHASQSNTTAYGSLAGVFPAGSNLVVQNPSQTDNSYCGVVFNTTNTAGNATYGYIGAAATSGSQASTLVFGQRSGSNHVERARIDSSGNVGIGTSSPADRLQINGGVKVTLNTSDADVEGGLFDYRPAGGEGRLFSYKSTGSNLLFFTNASGGSVTERARIDSSGTLLVGKTTQNQAANGVELLQVGLIRATSTTDAGDFYRKTTSAGAGVILTKSDIGGTNTLVGAGFANGTFAAVSDQRKKKNIVDARNYLDDLMQLRVVKYNWITDAEDTPKELGWIAQEVEQVFPGMITEMQGNKMLKKEVFIPMMLKAIQELSTKVDTLQAELNTLKGN